MLVVKLLEAFFDLSIPQKVRLTICNALYTFSQLRLHIDLPILEICNPRLKNTGMKSIFTALVAYLPKPQHKLAHTCI